MHIGTRVWHHSTNLTNKSQIQYQTSDAQRVDLRETGGKWVTEPQVSTLENDMHIFPARNLISKCQTLPGSLSNSPANVLMRMEYTFNLRVDL